MMQYLCTNLLSPLASVPHSLHERDPIPLTGNYLICCFIPIVQCGISCLINFTLFKIFWNQNPQVHCRTLRNSLFKIQWCSSLYLYLANSKCLSKRVVGFLHFFSWDLECWEFKMQNNYKCSVPYKECEALHFASYIQNQLPPSSANVLVVSSQAFRNWHLPATEKPGAGTWLTPWSRGSSGHQI